MSAFTKWIRNATPAGPANAAGTKSESRASSSRVIGGAVGLDVGLVVGIAVGLAVGPAVGLGVAVGRGEGVAVGLGVDAGVGRAVGSGVGLPEGTVGDAGPSADDVPVAAAMASGLFVGAGSTDGPAIDEVDGTSAADVDVAPGPGWLGDVPPHVPTSTAASTMVVIRRDTA